MTEKRKEFLLIEYKTRRDEIMHRMSVRERYQQLYIFGTITYTFVLSNISNEHDIHVATFVILPLLSFVISIQIRAQTEAIDDVSRFIRYVINDELIENNMWQPHWAIYTRLPTKSSTAIGEGEAPHKRKSRMRYLSHFVAIHSSAAASMIITFTILFDDKKYVFIDIIFFFAGVLLFIFAMDHTRRSLKYRNREDYRDIKIPNSFDV